MNAVPDVWISPVMPKGAMLFFCLLIGWFPVCSQGFETMDKPNNKLKSNLQFGFQLVPFLIQPKGSLGAPIEVDNQYTVRLFRIASTNPSLQAGFFLNRQVGNWLLFRFDANLLHRSVGYFIADPSQSISGASYPGAVTVQASPSVSLRLIRNLYVGAGLGTQFHFVDVIPERSLSQVVVVDPNQVSFWSVYDEINYQLSSAIRPTTFHTQYGLVWKFKKWNLAWLVQESLNSFTSSIEYQGERYQLPEVRTRIHTLNIGYVILPPKRTKTERRLLRKLKRDK